MDFSASKCLILIVVTISLLVFFNFSSSPSPSTTSSPSSVSTNTEFPDTKIPQKISDSSSSSSITLIVPALELHPTCEIARKLIELSSKQQQQQGNTKETKLFSQVSIRSDHICFKHGGHVPGSTRRGIASLESFSSKKLQEKVRNFDDLEWRILLQAGNDNSLQLISPSNADYSSLFVFSPPEWKIKFPPQSRISYVEIENCLVLFDGKSESTRIFSPVVSKEEKVRNIPLSGVYSIVSNNWPQTLTTSFQIHALEEIPESALQNHPQTKMQVEKICRNDQRQAASEFCKKFTIPSTVKSEGSDLATHKYAYFQMPTDFISSYHVTVEVTLTMFHAVFRSLLVSSKTSSGTPAESFWNSIVSKYQLLKQQGKSKKMFQLPCKKNNNNIQYSSVVITSKPKKAMWGFKPKSCKFGSAICLNTVWASMYVTLFSFLTNGANINNNTNGNEPESACPLALTSTGKERGDFLIKGLDNSNNNKNDLMILESVETLQVGYPTFCEPLWGVDPILLHDYYFKHSAETPSERSQVSTNEARVIKALKECDLLLWMMRNIMIEASSVAKEKSSGTQSKDIANTNIAVTQPKRVKIVYATRRGDWARDVLNEEVLLRKLDSHISQKYYHHNGGGDTGKNMINTSASSKSHIYSHISVAKFSGKLEDQILKVASSSKRNNDSTLFTIYIAAHGANILPSLFLPLNAGVVTLEVYSDGSSGFYPYGVFPSWLHWKRIGLDRVCNRRLDANGGVNGTATASKKKCKVRSPNNDDLVASDAQINKILSLVDEIVELQEGAKTKKGESKFKAL